MTFDIGLHEVCVRTGVRYIITKFSGMDGLPNFLTHGAPLHARFAHAGAPLKSFKITLSVFMFLMKSFSENSELKHADTRCGGQENIKEKEQAGASVATKCTVSTVTDC